MMGQIFVCWGIIYGIVSMGWNIIQRFDKTDWEISTKERIKLFACSGINSVVISSLSSVNRLLCVVAGCLLFACFTDVRACEVFQFTWWIAGAAGGILLYRSLMLDTMFLWTADFQKEQRLLSLCIYMILQELFFCRMYGRADCHAFVTCAVVESALGMDFLGYLWHMIFAFGGLTVVQAFRHNINRKGNLKQPVAFLPYITVSFWLMIILAFR